MVSFTYRGYAELIGLIRSAGYEITGFNDYAGVKQPCILRHDVDLSPQAALKIAELESSMGVCSTYFVLLNTGFYNVFHSDTNRILHELIAMNHAIGLHFDAGQYNDINDTDHLCEYILRETAVLEQAVDSRIFAFSIHRPTKELLETRLEINGMVNSYGERFFKEFKYISDSRMSWRENPENIVTCRKYKQLQVLTHPIWYKGEEHDIREVLEEYIESDYHKNHQWLTENITDLETILRR